MCADRSIDTTARSVCLADLFVQRLAHAMQTLELKGLLVTCHRQDGRSSVRVMRCKLRIDPVGHSEQFPCTRDVGNVSVLFSGENRIAFKAHDLRALDFCIPIGALHEANHNATVELLCQRIKPVEHKGCARPISLNDYAKAAPACQTWIRKNRLNNVERQIETILLFCVDVQPHIRLARGKRQLQQTCRKHRQHGFLLGDLISWMNGRQFYRYSVIFHDITMSCPRLQSRDRVGIRPVIAQRISFGPRSLAEHVEGIGVALVAVSTTALDRFLDRTSENELLAHLTHCRRYSLSDDRFAKSANHRTQGALDTAIALFEHAARQHQRPGRRIDEDGRGLTGVGRPVVWRDLVSDQIIHRLGIGNAQQRLGKTHQRHAFARRQSILRQKDFHQLRIRCLTHRTNEVCGPRRNGPTRADIQSGDADQSLQRVTLVDDCVVAKGCAKRIELVRGHVDPSSWREDQSSS